MVRIGFLVKSSAHAIKHVSARPAILLIALAAWTVCASDRDPSITFLDEAESQNSESRWCTADELLPRQFPKHSPRSPEWSTEAVVKPPYGCDCSFYKSRYFCPSQGDQGYAAWVPQGVADGVCQTVARSNLSQAPLPPGFKVLMYGNSHLRQVVEALMCMFHRKVKSKLVRYDYGSGGLTNEEEKMVPGDTSCRACSKLREDAIETFLDRGCMSEEDQKDSCRCDDDYGEFIFKNGAIVHFFFAHKQEEKSLSDALAQHGKKSWSWYDAVFANEGNRPSLLPESVLKTLVDLRDASVPFFWLNTYSGKGEVSEWDEKQTATFRDSGAKHVKIDAMVHGMQNLTKGAVEGNEDDHFCLPGPPDEVALLLLKMMWALHFEA